MINGENTNKKVINEKAFYKTQHLNVDEKKYTNTLLFAVFLGMFGAHRFYNRRYATGILMFLTYGGMFIWTFIDIILIISKRFKNSQGKVLSYDGRFYENFANIFAVGVAVFIPAVMIAAIGSSELEEKPSTTNAVSTQVEAEQKAEEVAPLTEATAETVNKTEDVKTEEVKTETANASTESTKNNTQDNTKPHIQVSNLGLEKSATENDTYIVYDTITNLSNDEVYTNFSIKVSFYSVSNDKNSVISTQKFNVFTNETLEPGESKQFEVECKVKGNFAQYSVDVVDGEIVTE